MGRDGRGKHGARDVRVTRGFKDVDGAFDIYARTQGRIGDTERNLQSGKVDDRPDAPRHDQIGNR